MRVFTMKTSMVAAIVTAIVVSGCGGKKEELKPAGKAPEAKAVEINVNMVNNPSFKEWEGFQPTGWNLKSIIDDGTSPSYFGKSDKTRSGGNSVYLRGIFKTDKWMVLTQRLPAFPGYEIVASADIMTEGVKKVEDQEDINGVFIRFYDAEGQRVNERYLVDAHTGLRLGDSGWSRDIVKAMTPAKAHEVEIGLMNLMTGHVYFNDVSLIVKDKIDWKQKETKFITFNWLDQRPYPLDELEKEKQMIEEIASDVGIKKTQGKIRYFLYPDEKVFMQILERNRYRVATKWDTKELHTIETWNDHEMIHMILYDFGFPPLALAKGLVFYFRDRYNDWDLDSRTKRFLMQKRLPALHKTIDSSSWKAQDHAIVIPAWGSFVGYLINEFGMDKIVELYVAMDGVEELEPFSDAFMEIYGKDFQDVDRAWRLFIIRQEYNAAADSLPDK